jgi:hypothetical protein
VPASLKLLDQYGDDLQVLFVESQGASAPEAAAFVLKQKWLGRANGIWTIEHPCDSGSPGLPSAVLIGGDGRVLFNGNPLDGHKQIMGLIEKDNASRRTPPSDSPKALEPAWKEFGKGKIGSAIKLLDGIAEKDRPALGDAWQSTRDEFLKRAQNQIGRAQWELEHGYPTRSAERLDGLAKSCEGQADLKKSIDELRARLNGPEGKAERDAAKALEHTEAAFYEKGGDDASRKDLERSLAKFSSTKVGERVRGVLAIGAGEKTEKK